jgi:hypothetical protein
MLRKSRFRFTGLIQITGTHDREECKAKHYGKVKAGFATSPGVLWSAKMA